MPYRRAERWSCDAAARVLDRTKLCPQYVALCCCALGQVSAMLTASLAQGRCTAYPAWVLRAISLSLRKRMWQTQPRSDAHAAWVCACLSPCRHHVHDGEICVASTMPLRLTMKGLTRDKGQLCERRDLWGRVKGGIGTRDMYGFEETARTSGWRCPCHLRPGGLPEL